MEITRILASKYNGEQGGTSVVASIASGSSATLTLTIPNGYRFYLMEYGGNATTESVKVDIRNTNNTGIQTYSEFPDFFNMIQFYPFFQMNFRKSMNVLFTNNGSGTTVVTFLINGILIPEGDYLNFEKELKEFASIPQILKGCE